MPSRQIGFTVERASTVDANKLVYEITVSGHPEKAPSTPSRLRHP